MTLKEILKEALRKLFGNLTSTKTWGFIAACVLLSKGLISMDIWQYIALVFIGAQGVVSVVALIKNGKKPEGGDNV